MDEPRSDTTRDDVGVALFACPECGSDLVHTQGCVFCGSCDYSRCG